MPVFLGWLSRLFAPDAPNGRIYNRSLLCSPLRPLRPTSFLIRVIRSIRCWLLTALRSKAASCRRTPKPIPLRIR